MTNTSSSPFRFLLLSALGFLSQIQLVYFAFSCYLGAPCLLVEIHFSLLHHHRLHNDLPLSMRFALPGFASRVSMCVIGSLLLRSIASLLSSSPLLLFTFTLRFKSRSACRAPAQLSSMKSSSLAICRHSYRKL